MQPTQKKPHGVDSGNGGTTRRDFMKASTAAAVGASLVGSVLASKVYAAGAGQVKIGLVGCGGRGSGAAVNALSAEPDGRLVAMCDMFGDKLDASLQNLALSDVKAQVEVPGENRFTGFEGYKGLLDKVDVVLLATPPHFRPMQLKAAVEANKHVFCEKPVAVDAPGVRSVIETCNLARTKNLSVLSGLCYRYDAAKQELMAKVHEGAIGDMQVIQSNYLTGGLWSNPRKPEWSDMEWQLRNWLYFTWLSGDHIVEQHIHSLDKALWAMKDVPPARVTATGGRVQRTSEAYGNVYDHFATVFEWLDESGQPKTRCFAHCRQFVGCDTDVSDTLFGTKGVADVMRHTITGENKWKRRKPAEDMYTAEHRALFAAIKEGNPLNSGDYMTKATLMAIMARQSAYSGKTITWEQAMNSQENLTPPAYEFGPLPVAPVAVPGEFKFT